jgi:small subunit ribosomal protein S6
MLMLDTAAPDEQRTKVLSDVQAMVGGRGGEIVNEQDWGTRPTAYEIRHKTDAEYHLLQFHATRELLETMHRTLRITDGVLRFRIIKLAPGTPDAPEAPAAPPRPTAEAPEAPPAEAPAFEAPASEAPEPPSAPEEPEPVAVATEAPASEDDAPSA